MAPVYPHFPFAHIDATSDGPASWSALASAWSLDPLVLGALATAGWIYRRGSRRLRTRVGADRGLRGWERGCFWAGWWTLVVALVSPLHPWGQVLFTAHMTQHELLMLVAAPLLVLGRPLVALLLALPREEARALASCARVPWFRATWAGVSHPLGAWLIHAVALWIWHVPALFEATLRSEWVHHFQHISFFGSALLFWWALLQAQPGWRHAGVATLYLFTTMMHSGLLGALILFAGRIIYPAYTATAPAWGLSPLEDQQLGGLIMWVPGGMVYVVATLVLLVGWLRRAERERTSAQVSALIAHTRVVSLLLLAALACSGTGCSNARMDEAAAHTGGDPTAGRRKIRDAGCATCHVIPGVPGARGQVGPSLAGIANRRYLGGTLVNNTDNMVRWLLDPRAHNPRTAMPKTLSEEADARDIAAYLYTLRE